MFVSILLTKAPDYNHRSDLVAASKSTLVVRLGGLVRNFLETPSTSIQITVQNEEKTAAETDNMPLAGNITLFLEKLSSFSNIISTMPISIRICTFSLTVCTPASCH